MGVAFALEAVTFKEWAKAKEPAEKDRKSRHRDRRRPGELCPGISGRQGEDGDWDGKLQKSQIEFGKLSERWREKGQLQWKGRVGRSHTAVN